MDTSTLEKTAKQLKEKVRLLENRHNSETVALERLGATTISIKKNIKELEEAKELAEKNAKEAKKQELLAKKKLADVLVDIVDAENEEQLLKDDASLLMDKIQELADEAYASQGVIDRASEKADGIKAKAKKLILDACDALGSVATTLK